MKTPFNRQSLCSSVFFLIAGTQITYAGLFSDDLLYEFELDSDGWVFQSFNPPFGIPDASVNNGYLKITATNNLNNFGAWESPEVLVPSGLQLKDEKGFPPLIFPDLFQMTTRFTSDVDAREDTPNFRMRTFYPSFHQSSVMTVESVGNADYCPPGPFLPLKNDDHDKGLQIDLFGKIYNHYFYSARGSDTFKYAFDLLNFGATDQADGGLSLDYLAVNRMQESDIQFIQETFDCTNTTDQEKFTDFNALGVDSPVRFRGPQGMSLFGRLQLMPLKHEAKGGTLPPWIFGGYTTTFQDPIVENTTYRLEVTIASSTTEATTGALPTFRIRVNDSSFKASWYLNVDSVGENVTLPSQEGDATYRLYFTPRPELAGNDLIFSLDYLWVNGDGNSISKAILLKEVRLLTTSLSSGGPML